MVEEWCMMTEDLTSSRFDSVFIPKENVLYDLIGRQDKGLATAYQVRIEVFIEFCH